jgi:uncharacterized protein YbjT (DUF2867 family)
MNILICGATGFVGRHLAAHLTAAGHAVTGVARQRERARGLWPQYGWISGDYTRDTRLDDWLPRLRGVHYDAVINAVGILRDSRRQPFDALHELAPKALFAAALEAGVPLSVQISALGAGQVDSRYHRSKHAADEFLAALGGRWQVLRPSLIYGPGGASTRMFLTQSALPLIPLVGSGDQRVQPVHVNDLVSAVQRLIDDPVRPSGITAAVGARAVSLRELYAIYRHGQGLGAAHFLPIPLPLIQLAARLGDLSGLGPLSSETLGMLQIPNVADASPFTALLGRPPLAPEQFFSTPAAH